MLDDKRSAVLQDGDSERVLVLRALTIAPASATRPFELVHFGA